MALPYSEAVWYFLAVCEDRIVVPLVRAIQSGVTPLACEETAVADSVINHAKWPLHWLASSCAQGGRIPTTYDNAKYGAALRMSELGLEYLPFETAFTYASQGLMRLDLEGKVIAASGVLPGDPRFDAYDRLSDLQAKSGTVPESSDAPGGLFEASVRVDGEWFEYALTPRRVRQAMVWARPALERRFATPMSWEWTDRYSLDDYVSVLRVLWTISMIHLAARLTAAAKGCEGLGVARALVIMESGELVRRVARYSERATQRVAAVIEDLTYGQRGQRVPDPALQPLVQLTESSYGWSPNLVVSSDLERNLVVLMNRIPGAKAAYARWSHEKEDRLRQRVVAELASCGFRAWHGAVSGWGKDLDLDLVLISDAEKACLLLELKSFVNPAEPLEVIHRSEEISRGIEQVRARKRQLEAQPQPVRSALSISAEYAVAWVVASENSIGGAWVQAADVPVVNAGHLTRRLLACRSILEVSAWLGGREYLPVEGRDYSPRATRVTVAGWSLDWFGIELHVDSLS